MFIILLFYLILMGVKDLKVSIILAVNNCENFIAETIHSVLNQTHKNFELLIIDDCSSDETMSIIKSFSDKRIVLFENKKCEGLTYSINLGLKNASGEYVAFLNSGDLWEENKLEKCLGYMTLNSLNFVYSNYAVIDNDGTNTDVSITGPKVITQNMLIRFNYIGHSTVIYKREVYSNLIIPANIETRSEYALLILLLAKEDCHLFDEILVKCRKCSIVSSLRYSPRFLKQNYHIFKQTCGKSSMMAIFYSLVNALFYVLKHKKYRKNLIKDEESGTKFENGYFIAINLVLVMFLFIFGNSINSVKSETNFLNATNFTNNYPNVHLDVSSKGGLDFDKSENYMREQYGRKGYLHPTYFYNGELRYEYKGTKHNVKLCASPVYNDFQYTEYLSLPLYRDGFSVRKGPLNGAEFACYIPSSFADKLLSNLNLDSYEDLFNKNVVFGLSSGKYSCTMSINNIYLNSETKNWKQSNIEYDYYKTFSERAGDAIFSYCPSFFKSIGNGSLSFDLNSSYENFRSITNLTLDFPEDTNTVIDYKIIRSDGETFSYSLSKKEITTNFGDFNHIIIYIGIAIMISNIVILMLSKSFRGNMMKPTLISCGIILLGLFIGELFKTFLSTKAWPFLVFNYVGNGISVVVLIYMLVIAYFFKEEGTDD